MQATPSALQTRFEEHLRTKAIPDHLVWSYKKWLRYYLDYCPGLSLNYGSRGDFPRLFKKECRISDIGKSIDTIS